jgi:hypothetical protein
LARATGVQRIGNQSHSYTLFDSPEAVAARSTTAAAFGIPLDTTEMDAEQYLQFAGQSIDVRQGQGELFGNMLGTGCLDVVVQPECYFETWGYGNHRSLGNSVYASTTGVAADGTLSSESHLPLNENLDLRVVDGHPEIRAGYTTMAEKLKAHATPVS